MTRIKGSRFDQHTAHWHLHCRLQFRKKTGKFATNNNWARHTSVKGEIHTRISHACDLLEMLGHTLHFLYILLHTIVDNWSYDKHRTHWANVYRWYGTLLCTDICASYHEYKYVYTTAIYHLELWAVTEHFKSTGVVHHPHLPPYMCLHFRHKSFGNYGAHWLK